MSTDNFPDLPDIKIVLGKDNPLVWYFEDGSTVFSATAEVECTALGLQKACTLQNANLEAKATIQDADLTALGTKTRGTFTYILQTDAGGTETPVSWLGKLHLYPTP